MTPFSLVSFWADGKYLLNYELGCGISHPGLGMGLGKGSQGKWQDRLTWQGWFAPAELGSGGVTGWTAAKAASCHLFFSFPPPLQFLNCLMSGRLFYYWELLSPGQWFTKIQTSWNIRSGQSKTAAVNRIILLCILHPAFRSVWASCQLVSLPGRILFFHYNNIRCLVLGLAFTTIFFVVIDSVCCVRYQKYLTVAYMKNSSRSGF